MAGKYTNVRMGTLDELKSMAPCNQAQGSKLTEVVRVGTVNGFVPPAGQSKCNQKPENFKLGDMIWAPYVAPNLDPNATSADEFIAMSSSVGPIRAKVRPYIVIGILPFLGLVATPVYTSGGNGVDNLPMPIREQCIMVVAAEAPEPNIPGVRNGEAIRVTKTYGRFAMKEKSHARVADTTLVPFQYPIRTAARVSSESVQRIQKWHRLFLEKAEQEVATQAAWFRNHTAKSELKEAGAPKSAVWARVLQPGPGSSSKAPSRPTVVGGNVPSRPPTTGGDAPPKPGMAHGR